jgi:hypothetical protein
VRFLNRALHATLFANLSQLLPHWLIEIVDGHGQSQPKSCGYAVSSLGD